jgi:hypothetical protein
MDKQLYGRGSLTTNPWYIDTIILKTIQITFGVPSIVLQLVFCVTQVLLDKITAEFACLEEINQNLQLGLLGYETFFSD